MLLILSTLLASCEDFIVVNLWANHDEDGKHLLACPQQIEYCFNETRSIWLGRLNPQTNWETSGTALASCICQLRRQDVPVCLYGAKRRFKLSLFFSSSDMEQRWQVRHMVEWTEASALQNFYICCGWRIEWKNVHDAQMAKVNSEAIIFWRAESKNGKWWLVISS